ncbi:sulfotransferase family protein [Citreicella sp. C3M06]|uniref:sulfotransferase family 2 domain-containing protein n=1 Tax=Citreicella sp. C3M06 TaxID=2841564 RepID=UPI001C085FED|nr:sulfotransferase family 2 domain-containing protein [Citreicella sp. C3M06]MBU2960846.1 sulfotransferase family protein [Citreicella sp. C3M06]
MIISRGRRYIFVHIPKTGGTSMAAALEARAMHDDILIGDTPKARRRRHRLTRLNARGRLWKHATLADIDGVLSPAEIAAMFTFTLVRNPWDRVVSYYHWLRMQNFSHPAVTRAKAFEFKAFVLQPETTSSLAAHPSSHYMRAADGVERASLYLRLERFEEDIAPLVAHLGFVPAMGFENPSPRGQDWRAYYDNATATAVARACAEDIERHGYSFG